MRHIVLGDDGTSDGKRPLGIVRRLTDLPLPLHVANVSGNDAAGRSLEASDAMRIPTQHVVVGKSLGLLTDSITRRDALEAPDNAISDRKCHVTQRVRQSGQRLSPDIAEGAAVGQSRVTSLDPAP